MSQQERQEPRPEQGTERLREVASQIVAALADQWAYPLDHPQSVQGDDELVLSLLQDYATRTAETTPRRAASPNPSVQLLDEYGNWRAGTWEDDL